MTMCMEPRGCLVRLLHECESSKLGTSCFRSKHVNGYSVPSALFFPKTDHLRYSVIATESRPDDCFPYSQKVRCWNTGLTEDKAGLDQIQRRTG